jgi:L,D-transpeptidase catalytic domain
MPGVRIEVSLPTNRQEIGTLRILNLDNGRTLLADIPVLGRADRAAAAAHGNPSRDPLRPYGDTPLGTYQVVRVHTTGPNTAYSPDSYGPNGGIRLEPTGGDAFVARANGRTGLMIHGGRDRGNGRLVPTNGCLRVSDADMQRIIDTLVNHSHTAAQNRCEAIRIQVGIRPAGPDENYDIGDPPPDGPATPIIP